MKKYAYVPVEKSGTFFPLIKLSLALVLLLVTAIYVMPLSGKIAPKMESVLSEIPFSDSKGSIQNVSVKSEQSTAERKNTTESEILSAQNGEYSTPKDILAMQQEYISTFADVEAAGTVTQEFASSKSATDVVGNVAIRNCTAEQKPDFEALLKKGISISPVNENEPLVLIFHTHTTESYLCVDDGVFYSDFETRTDDSTKNMVRVGDEICNVLEENGIAYVHDTKIYDESYNGAYSRSRVTVLDYLEKYPSIQVVLDVHRDAVYYSDSNRAKFVSEINGKKAAQIMIITGAQEGLVTDFPDWEENLSFALALQKSVQSDYEGLMKPIYFCQRKYNMDVVPLSLLVEIGTDANTLEEAVYSAHLLGQSLAELIKENIVE